jgi:hypothetical protein
MLGEVALVSVQNTGGGCIVRLKLALLPRSTYISKHTCIFSFTDVYTGSSSSIVLVKLLVNYLLREQYFK